MFRSTRLGLADPRVELDLVSESDIRVPFAAVPSCLQLADENSARLRDLVFLELATPFLHEKHSLENPAIEKRIERNTRFVAVDKDVASLFQAKRGTTIFVAAAGPSLSDNIEWLRSHRHGSPLVAVNSALKPLAQAGIYPDVVVVIDDDPKILSCFEGFDLSPSVGTSLVYFPRVPAEVLELWPGPRLAAYADHASYRQIASEYPKGKLFAAGSVLHSAVDLAVQMGAAEVVLLGADLACPDGRRYARGAGWDEATVQTRSHWVLDGYGRRVDTTASLRGYLGIWNAISPTIRGLNLLIRAGRAP